MRVPRLELTDAFLRKLKPSGKRFEVADGLQRGLYARVSPSGEASFAMRSRDAAGRLHTVTLGRYPDLKLREAREQTAIARQALKRGDDVNAEKRARRSARGAPSLDVPTLGDVLDEYQAAFSDRRAEWRPKGPRSTRGNARRCIEAVFTSFLDLPVTAIVAADLADAMTGHRRKRPGEKTTANGQVSRARAYLAPVLDWTAGRGRFAKHGASREPKFEVADIRQTFDPARDDPTITGERDRVLSENELAALLPLLVHPAPKALGGRSKPEKDFRPIAMRFLLLTAARREEAVELRRRDVDDRSGVWSKSRVKSTRGGPRKQSLPLSKAALDLLHGLPHFATAAPGDFLFPNTVGRPLGNWDRFQTMIETASGTSGWHRHDLRRTASSLMLALGIPVSTIDRIIGHGDPLRRENVSGAAATYMRVTTALKGRQDPQVAALNTLAEALSEIERDACDR